jgi:hypothetical protein
MPSWEIFGVLLLCALAWLWYDSLGARDAAIRAARSACDAEGLMLLDATVAITGLRTGRDDEGHLKLQRSYAFEYSDNGNNRHPGSVVMLGRQVLLFNVGFRPPAGTRTLH